MAGPGDFVKQNIRESTSGKVGKAFIAFDLVNLVTSEHKFKSVLKILRDIIFFKPLLLGMFFGMGKAIRSLVHDTGSLEAAVKKLTQIQGLNKMFAPLVGGVNAAKLKVAELVNFAASRNIKLGDAAEASRSLLLMTRGAFSGAEALESVNDAAKATGNSVTDMADAVGDFSDALHSGSSIQGATEHLRKMGAISDTTAASINQLQQNGASAGQVFGALTAELDKFHGGAEAAADDIDAINDAYEKAQANLQEKFGSPFVASDSVNTKNMTAAMNAFVPSVQRVSTVFSVLFNGLSTAKTMMARWVGESTLVRVAIEGLVYAITSLTVIAGAIGSISLIGWFAAAAVAAKSMGVAILFTTGMLASMALIAAVVVGIGVQLAAAFEREAKALQDLAAAHNAANAAIAKQINDIRTLTDRHEALAKAMDAVVAAQNELTEAQKTFNKAKIEEAEANLEAAKKNERRIIARGASGLSPVEERNQAERDRVKREIAQKEERFQAQMSISTPERQARLFRQHAAEAEARAKKGEAGEKERIKFAEQADQASLVVTEKKKKVEEAAAALKTAQTVEQGPFGSSDFVAARDARTAREEAEKKVKLSEQALKLAEAQQAAVGSTAEKGTSVQLEAAQRAMLLSSDPERDRKAAEIGLQAERARQIEAMRGENELIALREREAAKAIERETKLHRISMELELRKQNALMGKSGVSPGQKSRIGRGGIFEGTVAEAHGMGDRLKVDTRTPSQVLQMIADLGVFTDKYHELLDMGFDQEEAKTMADQFAKNAISLSADNAQLAMNGATVVDSLSKIGGGGGVYAPGADPMLSLAQRATQLHEEEVMYLKQIADAGKESGVL